MNTDAFYFYLVGAVLVVIVAIVWRVRGWRWGRGEDEPRAKYDAWLRRAVANGTHNEQGKPLCRICGQKDDSDTVATQWGFKATHDEGYLAWLRTRLGAPARYHVVADIRDDKAYDYCEQHALLAREELRAFLLHFEQERLDAILESEVQLARFEREGLDEVVKTRVEKHDKEVRPKQRERKAPKVVAIR